MGRLFAFGCILYLTRWIFVPNSLNAKVCPLVSCVYAQLIHLQFILEHLLFAYYI